MMEVFMSGRVLNLQARANGPSSLVGDPLSPSGESGNRLEDSRADAQKGDLRRVSSTEYSSLLLAELGKS